MKVYMENRHKVARHNILFEKGEKSYTLAMNHFGDLVHHILWIVCHNISNNSLLPNSSITSLLPS